MAMRGRRVLAAFIAALLGICLCVPRQRPAATFTQSSSRTSYAHTPGARRGRVVARLASASPLEELGISPQLRAASGVTEALKPFFAVEAKLQAATGDLTAAQNEILSEIRGDTFVIYTYELSPFCQEAKRILDELGIAYREVVLGKEWFLTFGKGAQKRAALGEMYGRTSLPFIFTNGNPFGGLYDGRGIGTLTNVGGPGLVPFLEMTPDAIGILKKIKEVDPTGGKALAAWLHSQGR